MIYAAWIANFSIKHMRAFYGLESVKAIRNLCRLFRTMVCQWYENNLIEFPLGSTGGIVQIDEMALGKAKYHKGSALKRNCNWVVGAVDTQPKRLAVQSVSERNVLTLKEFIRRSVTAGSTIYTDKWPAYNPLSDEGFLHFTVNHEIQFVNHLPDGTNVHTHNTEA